MATNHRSMKSKTRNRTNRVMRELKELRAQASAVGEDLLQLGGVVKGAAQGTIKDLRNTSTALYARGEGKTREVAEKIENYIREQPLKSMVIAACAGLILGRLMRR